MTVFDTSSAFVYSTVYYNSYRGSQMLAVPIKISNQMLNFQVLPKDSAWSSAAGVYMFCVSPGLLGGLRLLPKYIGQARNFADRIGNHERWEEASALGANCVMAAIVDNAADREVIERELIARYQPELNEQFRSAGLLGGYTYTH